MNKRQQSQLLPAGQRLIGSILQTTVPDEEARITTMQKNGFLLAFDAVLLRLRQLLYVPRRVVARKHEALVQRARVALEVAVFQHELRKHARSAPFLAHCKGCVNATDEVATSMADANNPTVNCCLFYDTVMCLDCRAAVTKPCAPRQEIATRSRNVGARKGFLRNLNIICYAVQVARHR